MHDDLQNLDGCPRIVEHVAGLTRAHNQLHSHLHQLILLILNLPSSQ